MICCRILSKFPFTQTRSFRGVAKIIRKELPKYKRSLKDLPALTQLLTQKHYEYVNVETCLNELNELRLKKLQTYKSFLPLSQKPILLEALFSTDNDIDRLLRIIDENLETMTSFYVAAAFESLDDMMRYKQCDVDTVIVSPELKNLCTKALYKLRFFEADEVLKLIKCLSTIRLPEESLLTQAALQMARHLINDFNLEELEMLSDCLVTFEISDNSRKSLLLVLREAISVAKKNQIAGKLSTQSSSSSRLDLSS